MKKVYIMRGISGAGKSTYIKNNLSNLPDSIICSADNFFMKDGKYEFDISLQKESHKFCLQEFITAIQSGKENVICDNTNVVVWQLSPYVCIAEAFGYEVEIIEIHITAELAAQRTLHGRTEKDLKGTLFAMNQKLPRAWKVKKIQATI